ncbi:MAG: phosphotransferase [Clostridia bacterium]|nr:phosphotransferase [Clostridia bacterium]
MFKSRNNNDFEKSIRNILISENLILETNTLEIKKIHKKEEQNGIIYHYIISVNNIRKFLLRTVKEHDYSYLVVNYLIELNKKTCTPCFPNAQAKPFKIADHTYILTSYLSGNDLGKTLWKFSNKELIRISKIIDSRLKQLHSVTNLTYSDGYNFFGNIPFPDIMFKKIQRKFYNEPCIKKFFNEIDIEKILIKTKEILNAAKYSVPTLIHLDVKPANIIVTQDKNNASLIDFELARFSDVDYEWTNLLIKTKLYYNKRFIKYVLEPIITNNFKSLAEALKTEKYKIYILYHAINNYIYYDTHHRKCPKEVVELIKQILGELN